MTIPSSRLKKTDFSNVSFLKDYLKPQFAIRIKRGFPVMDILRILFRKKESPDASVPSISAMIDDETSVKKKKKKNKDSVTSNTSLQVSKPKKKKSKKKTSKEEDDPNRSELNLLAALGTIHNRRQF